MHEEVYFKEIRQKILENIRKSESSLQIAVAWFTDKKIIETINDLLDIGVKVEILIFGDKINKKTLYEDLFYNGAKIFISKKMMHNKFCIIDNRIIMNGSYNWTLKASSNEENILISYDNAELIEKFRSQFERLVSGCPTIDSFFTYSLSNIDDLTYKFERYYSNWRDYNFPYFLNTFNVKNFRPNLGSGIGRKVFLVKNESEERRILWYSFLQKNKYSISKVLKASKSKLELPTHYTMVHGIKYDENSVSEFRRNETIVEKTRSLSDYTRRRLGVSKKYLVFKIDKDGNALSEIEEYSYKLSDNKYLKFSAIGKSYIKEFGKKDVILEYGIYQIIDKSAFIGYNKKFGLVRFPNTIEVNLAYDSFIPFNESKCSFIEFVEYPILVIDYGKEKVYTLEYYSDSHLRMNHLVHQYSKKDYSFVSTAEKSDNEPSVNKEYIYFSKQLTHKEFYKRLHKFKFAGLNEKYVNIYLTPSEFNKLKQEYEISGESDSFNRILDSFHKKRLDLNKREVIKNSDSCYIATMVYKDKNHPKIKLLRNFRNQYLMNYSLGGSLISCYYKYSPHFVACSKKSKCLNSITKIVVDIIVAIIMKTWNNKSIKRP